MDKFTKEVRMAHWAAIVSECQRSGMAKKAWCKENNISEKQFYYWQRIVRRRMADGLQPPAPQFVELPLPAGMPQAPSEVPDIILRVGGCVLEVSNSASASLVQSLVKVLAHV